MQSWHLASFYFGHQRSQEMENSCETFVWLLVCLVVAALCKPGMAVTPSSGCGRDTPHLPHPGSHKTVHINYHDKTLGPMDRKYYIQLPRGFYKYNIQLVLFLENIYMEWLITRSLTLSLLDYNSSNSVSVPLVFDLHGFYGNGHDQIVSGKR